uniref:Uncharacterized protein n=1 Tax=Anguilla anguilla TaxID=7936 RepID=A0A0E9VG10_ANGAN
MHPFVFFPRHLMFSMQEKTIFRTRSFIDFNTPQECPRSVSFIRYVLL